jgi:hypothetical protein
MGEDAVSAKKRKWDVTGDGASQAGFGGTHYHGAGAPLFAPKTIPSGNAAMKAHRPMVAAAPPLSGNVGGIPASALAAAAMLTQAQQHAAAVAHQLASQVMSFLHAALIIAAGLFNAVTLPSRSCGTGTDGLSGQHRPFCGAAQLQSGCSGRDSRDRDD